jgi:hypothetical protein
MNNPETSIHETPIPEFMTARTSQISGLQRKAEALKLQNILRETTDASGLPKVAHRSARMGTCLQSL